MEYQGLILDEFQEDALTSIDSKKSIIISAPTGSGKTLIAEYAIEVALREKKEVIYTAPIKALSNQKFRDFSRHYGKEKVGIMTGDLTFNSDAPILIMTTEIFRNALFENFRRFDNVLYLILDEVHYINDADRGSVWEESIIFAPPHIKILCLSATVPNVEELSHWIKKTRKEEIKIICEDNRPVPLHEHCYLDKRGVLPVKNAKKHLPKKLKKSGYGPRKKWERYDSSRDSMHEILSFLENEKHFPCLYFVFSRKECEQNANRCRKYNLLNKKESNIMRERILYLANLYNLKCSPDDYGIGSLLSKGIGYHHAGMVPALKEMVEQLFTEGLIKLLFATETFALGVNMPAKSVVFNALKKYDGIQVRPLKALEYQQMSGRAGRRGLDKAGFVYADLADDIITVRELNKIIYGPLEKIKSQFNLSYNTILNVFNHAGEDLFQACDKSFASFQKSLEAEKEGGKKQKKKIYAQQRQIVKKRLALLKTLGYIEGDTLSSKGRFSLCINGYELALTELFYDGFFENQGEINIFMILVALVFEGKKSDRYAKPPKILNKVIRKVERRIQVIQSMEHMYGLRLEVKLPDFRLALASQAWAEGESFAKLKKYTSALPGDIVRTFRQAIQLCRQLKKACKGYDSFITALDQCILRVNRDEVNALKQLEIFTAIE